jgi:seryl-tRNA synthetase
VPDAIVSNLENIKAEDLRPLTVNQIKKVRVLIDEAIAKNEKLMSEAETKRNYALREVGNHLHESVPVDDDEVGLPTF